MSKLALGTVQFGLDYGVNNTAGQVKEAEVEKILDLASKSGIDVLDTAQAYGQSEEVIGRYIKNHTTRFRIVSKLPDLDALDVKKLFNESLSNLNCDKLYGYMFHSFSAYKKNPSAWEELIGLKSENKVDKIGFSLYFPEELEYLLQKNIPFDLIQIPYSVFDRRFENYFEELKKRGVEIHVRSVFLQGLVFKSVDNLETRFLKIKSKLELLGRISSESKVPISALCLNFAVQNEFIDNVVMGVDNKGNLEENLKNLSFGQKTKEHLDQINSLKEDDENIILPINWK